MAVLVKNKVVKNVGTVPVPIIETNPSTRITVIGLSLTNLLNSFVTISITVQDDASSEGYYLKDTILSSNTSLRAVSTGEKLVLAPDNKLSIVSSLNDSVDVILSYVETS